MIRVLVVFITIVGIIGSKYAQKSNNYAPNQLIVKFKASTVVDHKNCVSTNRFKHRVLDSLNTVYQLQKIQLTGNKKKKDTYILYIDTNKSLKKVIQNYEQTGLFEFVEPNFIGTSGGKQGMLQTIPNDTHFSKQWGLFNEGSFSLSPAVEDADIDMDLAWDVETGDTSIIIAVLDSGLKMNHPDINGRVWKNWNESSDEQDSDNNGYVGDVFGWDFANDDNDPTDDQGHGTNVAGIIGAEATNDIGYAGVDWYAKLMICKILENDEGFYSWWTDAIYYAVDNGANVLNMSVGGSGFSAMMEEAIDYAHDNGVLVVACMMNEDSDVVYYPAGYTNTIAVGSTDPNDERSSPFHWSETSGSSYGEHIDVVAPGSYTFGLHYLFDQFYESYWSGTSQAAPLVAGLCGLLLAQDASRTPDEVRTIIQNTAEDQVGDPNEDVEGFDVYYGHGRVNAYQALLQDPTASLEHVGDHKRLLVYPNPAENLIYIKNDQTTATITVLNTLGEVVLRKNIVLDEETVELNISSLSSGIYLVNVFNSKEFKTVTEKVVKK